MNELQLLERFRDDVAEPSTYAWLRARAAIDAAAREEERGHLEPRRRRPIPSRRRAIAALSAVAAVAVGIAVSLTLMQSAPKGATSASGPTGSAHARLTAATVRARVVYALSAPANTVLFTQSTMTTPGETAITSKSWDYPWSGRPGATVRQAGSSSVDGVVQNTWSLSFAVPSQGATSTSPGEVTTPWPSGVPLPAGAKVSHVPVSSLIEGEACGVAAQRLDVDYVDRTWQASVQSCVEVAPGLDAPAGLPDPATHQVVTSIREMVADGILQVVGYSSIDGQSTITLKSTTDGILALELWVNASTYLPVQSVMTGPTGDPNPGKTWTEEDRYSYLSPTATNLANLQVSAPTDFRQVVNPSSRG
jgi:hypothetical protein